MNTCSRTLYLSQRLQSSVLQVTRKGSTGGEENRVAWFQHFSLNKWNEKYWVFYIPKMIMFKQGLSLRIANKFLWTIRLPLEVIDSKCPSVKDFLVKITMMSYLHIYLCKANKSFYFSFMKWKSNLQKQKLPWIQSSSVTPIW